MYVWEHENWTYDYGRPLTVGDKVKVTNKSKFSDLIGGEFYVTSLSYDDDGLKIGINDGTDSSSTAYDGLRIDDLASVP
ncbi:hypothetical protein J4N45_10435 [Vibrio sp. SCSIO 43140]|uniref:hypothetical protein n=1 Tax=Vibrio sp. SCSIO 43140 TaxID=2819100 RepID=UPI002075B1F2|nr:hypothetical protein [Vibrio sp. SCSIO 43140]USD58947.1 hypothetical protein J4N45_10435 [Vibrio sp. SCSIO 43140]